MREYWGDDFTTRDNIIFYIVLITILILGLFLMWAFHHILHIFG